MNAKQNKSDKYPLKESNFSVTTALIYSMTQAPSLNPIRFIFCLLLLLLIISYTPK